MSAPPRAGITFAFACSERSAVMRYRSHRRGLRGDYRFGATKSKDDAPEFFGRETRYVHRVYAAVVINTVR